MSIIMRSFRSIRFIIGNKLLVILLNFDWVATVSYKKKSQLEKNKSDRFLAIGQAL